MSNVFLYLNIKSRLVSAVMIGAEDYSTTITSLFCIIGNKTKGTR